MTRKRKGWELEDPAAGRGFAIPGVGREHVLVTSRARLARVLPEGVQESTGIQHLFFERRLPCPSQRPGRGSRQSGVCGEPESSGPGVVEHRGD